MLKTQAKAMLLRVVAIFIPTLDFEELAVMLGFEKSSLTKLTIYVIIYVLKEGFGDSGRLGKIEKSLN